MKIIYTTHAEKMLILRNVDRKQVEKCIETPDKILSAKGEAKIYLKKFGKDYLKLVIAEQKNDFIIVTLHWLAKKRIKE